MTTSRAHAIATLRVNYKSLSAELRAIRQEIKKVGGERAGSLQMHRDSKVRPEARITNLALAAVRGTPYCAVERKCRIAPDLDRIVKKILKHCSSEIVVDDCYRWIRKANGYLHAEGRESLLRPAPRNEVVVQAE